MSEEKKKSIFREAFFNWLYSLSVVYFSASSYRDTGSSIALVFLICGVGMVLIDIKTTIEMRRLIIEYNSSLDSVIRAREMVIRAREILEEIKKKGG